MDELDAQRKDVKARLATADSVDEIITKSSAHVDSVKPQTSSQAFSKAQSHRNLVLAKDILRKD